MDQPGKSKVYSEKFDSPYIKYHPADLCPLPLPRFVPEGLRQGGSAAFRHIRFLPLQKTARVRGRGAEEAEANPEEIC